MFSGIIQTVGEVISVASGAFGIRDKEIAERSTLGSSVAVAGVCLTVAKKIGDTLLFAVMPETLKKTTLGQKKVADRVNLEPALRVGDELGGHFVYGHVDGVGEVQAVRADGEATLVTIQISKELMRSLAPQGSVAVDGVSLTVARQKADAIIVSLVPYTLEHTTLGQLRTGDGVNIECDMLVKMAARGITNES